MRPQLLSLAISLSVVVPGVSQLVVTSTGKDVGFGANYQSIIQPDGKTLDVARGVWQARGYGYVAEVTATEIQLFNETTAYRWPQTDIEAAELLVVVSENGKQAKITVHPDVPPFVVERIPALSSKQEPDAWTPSHIYAAFEQTMAENYVFFKERSFDWQKRVAKIRPSIHDSMPESDLYESIERTLEGLEDGHVQLGANINGEPRQAHLGLSATEKRGIELFQAQSKYSDFDEFVGSHVQQLESGIIQHILVGNVNQACEQLTWGIMKDNVGYLHIAGMAGFSEADSLAGQLTELHTALDSILTELANTRMLIVDVATNGGGSDAFSLAIASHFADQRRLAFTKGPRNAPEITHAVYIEPTGVRYTKPVRLVTNDVTMSAAEIFVLSMKDLLHVTTFGKATRGALSDVLSKTLPNGWSFGLSNEIYRDSKGQCFEAVGIPVDIEVTVIDPSKEDLGHAKAIAKIASMK